MNASLNWLKAYVPDLNVTDQEFFDAMTLSGTKGETYEKLDKNLEKIVIGQVKSIERHPDADKLEICQVDVGTETLQIVTGAPNVEVGQKVPVVLDGGKVAGGHDGSALPEDGIEIKSGKLRGVDSYGMMCSVEELGSSREFYPEAPENGIYVFDEDAVVGSDAVEALGLRDTIFEYEITSNRVDCYSVIGIAREAAATYNLPLHLPEVSVTESDEKTSDFISVDVRDTDLCSRYVARVVTDIKIAPSPKWMQRRLASAGIRPINNLVDITNYIMLEYGQPMHAYNLDTVAGHHIEVRRALDGEKFTTLDGQERNLDKNVLMICDGEKEIGIAGIMGGENSMITDDVKTVLFEAATFNGANIRKSAKRIGLRTDASGFFEKGLDPVNAEDAINRACQLITELSCGKVTKGIVEAGLPIKPLKKIKLEPEVINNYLGTDISKDEMVAILKREQISVDANDDIIIPSFRQDLNQMCDISEEIARFHGYDKIPSTLPKSSATTGKLTFKMRVEAKAREVAQFCGFSQAYCYSFESPKVLDKLLLAADAKERQCIRISNPLGEDYSVMRTISLNGILSSLANNYNRRNKDVSLYEMANIYVPKQLPLTELPDERMQLTLASYGEGDFYTMKGVIEELLSNVGMDDKVEYKPDSAKPFLHPGRQANVLYDGEVIGYLGEVHPDVCDNYNMDGVTVYAAVIDMPEVVKHASFNRVFTGIAKFPAVTRDISMLVPKDILAGDIEKILVQRGGKILESYELFDIYEGEQVKKGYKSMAYSLSFRDKEKTLLDDDVNGAMKKILNGLERMEIELRK